MDKTWLNKRNRNDPLYLKGADEFVKFASSNRKNSSEILCPCNKCRNMKFVKKDDVVEHIVVDGFLDGYTCWIFHGESMSSSNANNQSAICDEMQDMLGDAFGVPSINIVSNLPGEAHVETTSTGAHQSSNAHVEASSTSTCQGLDDDTQKFFNLLKEAERELYPGCKKYSKLSFLVRLLHLKCLDGWSNKSFTMLLELLKDSFPEGETLPKSFDETKSLIKDLGLDHIKIHACPNDCMIYWNETQDRKECKYCKTPRYKQFSSDSPDAHSTQSKIPTKVFRYFPLIPRLQRLYMSSKTASEMIWHADGRIDDGYVRHPADSLAWKHFDSLHPDFAQEPRNIRLGLAADGFNPFRSMSISHSTWPVILIPYNLPPWLCMTQPYMFMILLIDGPHAPGNDIDVYLRPLIDELKQLWVGVRTFDAKTNEMFMMRASLLWTINDFPAYANLSGWSTKGKYACSSCHSMTKHCWLRNGHKHCYIGHRRWLPEGHKFRYDKSHFDGTIELESRPTRLSGADIWDQVKSFQNVFGKDPIDQQKKRKRGFGNDNMSRKDNWKKRSIFFELEYWRDNLLFHNIDVMHTESNVCGSIVRTLLDPDGKGKDNLSARLDLQEMGIRKDLHPQPAGNNKVYLPASCFTLDTNQKELFCKALKDIKAPDGYCSNISRCVNLKQRTIYGLKSHDNHVLMQQLLPITLRNLLPKNVLKPLIEVSSFFRLICAKIMRVEELEHAQDRIALTLCHLERIFPPTFFDIMVHLTIHLAEEAKIGGPPQYRWMYPIERYLFTLKKYVKNRSRPEGSIEAGYWIEECLTFCSRYLQDVETRSCRPHRNCETGHDYVSREGGRRLGKANDFMLDDITYVQAHRYVLVNSEIVAPFYHQHIQFLKNTNPRLRRHEIDRIHNETFHTWFRSHVEQLASNGTMEISEEVKKLAIGPSRNARSFKGYIINGTRYLTKSRDTRRKTQNSGIMLNAETNSYASAKDKNPVAGNVIFYGVLTDIIELYYSKNFRFVLFKCDWVDNRRGLIEHDDYGFTLVNFNHLLYRRQQLLDEPFILATQAQQVFYVQDPVEKDWKIVVKVKPRDFFDMNEQFSEVDSWGDQQLGDTSDDIAWVREGVGNEVEYNLNNQIEGMDEDEKEDDSEE